MNEELIHVRKEIARIDEQIFLLISKRFESSRKIGELKKHHGFAVENSAIEIEIYERNNLLGLTLGFDSNFSRQLSEILIHQSKNIQQKILNAK